jgi:hypothetical protein
VHTMLSPPGTHNTLNHHHTLAPLRHRASSASVSQMRGNAQADSVPPQTPQYRGECERLQRSSGRGRGCRGRAHGDAAALEQRQKHNAGGGGAWQPARPAWNVVLPTALSSDSSPDLTANAALFSRKTERASLPQTAAPFSKYVSKYVAAADTGVSSSSETLDQSLENRGLGPRERVSLSLPVYTYPDLYRHAVTHPSQHTFRLPAGHYYFKLQACR